MKRKAKELQVQRKERERQGLPGEPAEAFYCLGRAPTRA
jgi:hypothetical protein